jgi:hypothetical protein
MPHDDLSSTAAVPGRVGSTDLFGCTASEAMERSATLSACRTYRYALWRRWGRGDYAMFIGLNPSTADETNDDPTIRRCIGFARAWGYGALCMANLFAYRATDPADMKQAAEPVGWENDQVLRQLADQAGVVVAAWGTHGTYKGRDQSVRLLVPGLHYLRLTINGHPAHPLYLPASLQPQRWVQW